MDSGEVKYATLVYREFCAASDGKLGKLDDNLFKTLSPAAKDKWYRRDRLQKLWESTPEDIRAHVKSIVDPELEGERIAESERKEQERLEKKRKKEEITRRVRAMA